MVEVLGYLCGRCKASYDRPVEFCWHCFCYGTVFARYSRPSLSRSSVVVQSAFDAAKQFQKTMELPVFGVKIGVRSWGVLYGAPGSGKSSVALRCADEFSPALFFSFEMGLGPALSSLLRRNEVHSKDLHVVGPCSFGDLLGLVEERSPRLVVVDSLNMCALLADDLEALARRLDGGFLLGLLQVTKEGVPAGSNKVLHGADLVMRLGLREDKRVLRVEKSRFEATPVEREVGVWMSV